MCNPCNVNSYSNEQIYENFLEGKKLTESRVTRVLDKFKSTNDASFLIILRN